MNMVAAKTPVHLWIVAIVTLLWNAMGAFDFTASQLRIEFYMEQFTAEQLDYFYAFPMWVVPAWGVATWTSLLGSLSLLMRKRWAVWLFGASITGMIITTFYNYVLTNGLEIMGTGGAIFSAVIWIIALLLFFYARAMTRRGVLK